MSAMLPQPTALTAEVVTLSRADWEGLIDAFDDLQDRAFIAQDMRRAIPSEGFSGEEMLRIVAGETRLRVLRDRLGLKARQLAIEAGADYSYVSEIDNGRKPGSAKVLRALAAALGVPMEMLLA